MADARTANRQREGQRAFNALYAIRPDLAEQVRGTDLDPFYDDSRLPDFHAWLVMAVENGRCPECNGRGVVVDPWTQNEDRCPTCNGRTETENPHGT